MNLYNLSVSVKFAFASDKVRLFGDSSYVFYKSYECEWVTEPKSYEFLWDHAGGTDQHLEI